MSQAPGWYPDPFDRGQERYWDGKLWTQGTRPEGGAEDATGSGPQGDLAGPVRESVTASPTPAAPPDQQAMVSGAVDPARGTPVAEHRRYSAAGRAGPTGCHLGLRGTRLVASPMAGVAQATRRDLRHRRTALCIGAAALVLVAGGVSAGSS